MGKKAVFLDRDHTLIEKDGVIDSPEKVKIVVGAPVGMRRLREAGYSIVVVTNQPGVARGLFDEDTLVAIHERLMQLLGEASTSVDAIYYCPFLDGEEATVGQYRMKSDLRKPKPGMLLQAAADLKLDLTVSWMIGDSLSDMQAGRAAGCKTILLSPVAADKSPEATYVAQSLQGAADLILEQDRMVARGTGGGAVSTEKVLVEIRDMLRTRQRMEEREDFSLGQLAGAVVQVFAVALAFWGILDFTDPAGGYPLVVGRFLAAIFAQLLALTLFGLRR